MKITEIKRTVSDLKFNNLSATARIGDDEDPMDAAIALDSQVKEMMAKIDDKAEAVEGFSREKAAAVNILEDALKHAQNMEIPF